MSVKIIIDSTADVTPAVREKCTIVPLTVHFGDTEYVDGVTITHKDFYEKLIESDVLPTTSQPTPDAFGKEFKKVADAGDKAVVITISSMLSGTYQSANIAAMDYPGSIYVVDSKTVTIGAGILTQLAVELVEQGKSAEEIVEIINEQRDKVCLIAMLDTLEYLKKGGRISKTVAFAGELLSIKPVISVPEGQIQILGKARGSKQGNNLLVREIQKAGGVDFTKPCLLGYSGLSDMLLQKYVRDSAELWEGHIDQLYTAHIGSVIGTHAGPGAIAVAFFKNT